MIFLDLVDFNFVLCMFTLRNYSLEFLAEHKLITAENYPSDGDYFSVIKTSLFGYPTSQNVLALTDTQEQAAGCMQVTNAFESRARKYSVR